jgi:hypothetical protein
MRMTARDGMHAVSVLECEAVVTRSKSSLALAMNTAGALVAGSRAKNAVMAAGISWATMWVRVRHARKQKSERNGQTLSLILSKYFKNCFLVAPNDFSSEPVFQTNVQINGVIELVSQCLKQGSPRVTSFFRFFLIGLSGSDEG